MGNQKTDTNEAILEHLGQESVPIQAEIAMSVQRIIVVVSDGLGYLNECEAKAHLYST